MTRRHTPKRMKRTHFPGSARTLDDGVEEADRDAETATGGIDLMGGIRSVEDGVLGALLQAARGGAQLGAEFCQDWSPGNKNVFMALRADLRSARSARGDEAAANEKVAAVRSGLVRIPMFLLVLQFICADLPVQIHLDVRISRSPEMCLIYSHSAL